MTAEEKDLTPLLSALDREIAVICCTCKRPHKGAQAELQTEGRATAFAAFISIIAITLIRGILSGVISSQDSIFTGWAQQVCACQMSYNNLVSSGDLDMSSTNARNYCECPYLYRRDFASLCPGCH